MPDYTQQNRPLAVDTPLGKDKLLITSFSGQEGLSQLFSYEIEAVTPVGTDVPFDRVLGQPVSVRLTLPGGQARSFNGICNRLTQGASDIVFTSYRLEVVPKVWLLTRRAQSRIFQHKNIPDILKEVLAGIDVSFELQGSFAPRDYCSQYRETDFNFLCRLLEEEGIYYYFKHANGSHRMVLANSPQAHSDVPGDTRILLETLVGGLREAERITGWEKRQELRSGKSTLWDHCFELPHKHLEAEKPIADAVPVGKATHKLKLAGVEQLELYDWPGEYAQRFDGVDKGGGDNSGDLSKIFEDARRTVEIRMQQETTPTLLIHGNSNCRQLAAGHKFTLDTEPGDNTARQMRAEGAYVLTSVSHFTTQSGYHTGETAFRYQNHFTCIPAALPFRPPRVTPRPVVQGTQSAVVVGPPGEEIFTDKYSRVKVQFHWDRQGKNNADSSCWLRVATPWAGKQWGMIHIPRIGQEVLVAFLEGDPDQPIIVGSLYNAEMMPPYKLPDKKTQSGLKTRSTLQGTPENFNELRFEDKKDSEEIYFHAEKDFNRVVENNDTLKVGSSKAEDGSQTIEIWNNRTENVKEGDEKVTIEKGNRTVTVKTGDDLHEVDTGNRTVTVKTGDDSHQIKMGNRDVQIDMGNDTLTIKMGNQTTKLNLGASSTEAMQSIELKVGQSSIKIDQMGVTIQGMMVSIQGQIQTQVQGTMTQVSGSAMLQVSGGITMIG
jgi:type VI secretion system secreted protein VgrG